MATRSLHLSITGRVQGVGYRAWLVRLAGGQGVSGWVRNRWDGSVEAVITGDDQTVEALVARCYDGPAAARVSRVESVDYPDRLTGDFRTLPTL